MMVFYLTLGPSMCPSHRHSMGGREKMFKQLNVSLHPKLTEKYRQDLSGTYPSLSNSLPCPNSATKYLAAKTLTPMRRASLGSRPGLVSEYGL
jgi:hypothetical protein